MPLRFCELLFALYHSCSPDCSFLASERLPVAPRTNHNSSHPSVPWPSSPCLMHRLVSTFLLAYAQLATAFQVAGQGLPSVHSHVGAARLRRGHKRVVATVRPVSATMCFGPSTQSSGYDEVTIHGPSWDHAVSVDTDPGGYSPPRSECRRQWLRPDEIAQQWPKPEHVVIPEGTTTLPDGAFRGCRTLKSVTLPSTLKRIGQAAFEGCSSLTRIDIPSGVETIGYSAFYGCSTLKHVSIPATVTDIDDCAFRRCGALEEVNVPESVVFLGRGAFSRCSELKSIIIPKSVTRLRGFLFTRCSSLESITMHGPVTDIDEVAIRLCPNLTSIKLPNSLKRIGTDAFHGCSQLVLEVPDSVESIGDYAFSGCSMFMISPRSPAFETFKL